MFADSSNITKALLASRKLLQVSLQCKVANQAMADTAMTASVTLDINLRPLSTR